MDPARATTHFAAAVTAGLVATTTSTPFDVLKTRQHVAPRRTLVESVGTVVQGHGAGGFMRGWTAGYIRTCAMTVIIFVLREQFNALLGLDPV